MTEPPASQHRPSQPADHGWSPVLWGLSVAALAVVGLLVSAVSHPGARELPSAKLVRGQAPLQSELLASSDVVGQPGAELDAVTAGTAAACSGQCGGPESAAQAGGSKKLNQNQTDNKALGAGESGHPLVEQVGSLRRKGRGGQAQALSETDGESAFPAGTGQPAPFASEGSTARQPLQRTAGKTAVLWTDTRPEYAAELLGRLDSFLAQAHAEMGKILEVSVVAKPVQIYVFESQERYQEYAREHAPGLVNNGGFYDGGMRTVVTYRYNNSMQLYFHELVHAMMGEQFGDHHFTRYTRRNWPIWFDEGIAEFLGSFDLIGKEVHVPAVNKGKLAYLVNAMANNVFIDLPTLLKAPAERFSGPSMNIYYAESWGLLDFLLSSPVTRPKLSVFFKKIKGGEDGLSAFRSCFGDNLQQLDATWRAYLYERARTKPGAVQLFGGSHIDDWTIHEGGQWLAGGGEISGHGDRNYNYLIKSELPSTNFTYQLDVNLAHGTAGLILGNNFHGEYPYYYLIEIARDVVMVRRAWSASHIEPVIQAYAELPPGSWVQVRASVADRVLRLYVAGREVLQTRVDRDRYSLFGLYLYRAKVRFRNISLVREVPAALLSTPAVGSPLPSGSAAPAGAALPAGSAGRGPPALLPDLPPPRSAPP